MEGGYDLNVLSYGWLNIARALLGKNDMEDPLGAAPEELPLPANFIDRLRDIHHLN
jgi:hypothetical protein